MADIDEVMKGIEVKVKKLRVRNFKSLKDFELDLQRLNVIIGPNGSGKTNSIEALKLFKMVLDYLRGEEINPFLEWWGYKNAVWKGDENLPITIDFEYSVTYKDKSVDSSYEITVAESDKEFKILEERISILSPLEVTLLARSDLWKLILKRELLEKYYTKVSEEEIIKLRLEVLDKLKANQEVEIKESPHRYLMKLVLDMIKIMADTESVVGFMHDNICDSISESLGLDAMGYHLSIVLDDLLDDLVYPITLGAVGAYIIAEGTIILGRIEYKAIREPIHPKRELIISGDGSNLISVLSSVGEIPERVVNSIKYVFGMDSNVRLETTSDGRAYLKFYDGKSELNPPSVPDGLYKLVILELALERNAPIIACDEIENSLHARTIRYVIDEIRNSSSVGIFATHSPAVIDILRPEEVVILEKDQEGATKPHRFEKPAEISAKLNKLGVTFSEYILYGGYA